MKFFKALLLFAVCGALFVGDAAARCRVADLIACLDSVCTEPGQDTSRCYMCGTSRAERPVVETALGGRRGGEIQMQALAVGGTRHAISERDLRAAPERAEDRYIWAQEQCLARQSDCTQYDIEEHYDPLIERACEIALIDADFRASIAASRVRMTEDQCRRELMNCMLGDNRCGQNMLACETNEDFNRNFSYCAVEFRCDDFTTTLRVSMFADRDRMIAERAARIAQLVSLRQSERQDRIDRANQFCERGFDMCVLEMCGNFPIGVEGGVCVDRDENMWARNLCAFVNTACQRLR